MLLHHQRHQRRSLPLVSVIFSTMSPPLFRLSPFGVCLRSIPLTAVANFWVGDCGLIFIFVICPSHYSLCVTKFSDSDCTLKLFTEERPPLTPHYLETFFKSIFDQRNLMSRDLGEYFLLRNYSKAIIVSTIVWTSGGMQYSIDVFWGKNIRLCSQQKSKVVLFTNCLITNMC